MAAGTVFPHHNHPSRRIASAMLLRMRPLPWHGLMVRRREAPSRTMAPHAAIRPQFVGQALRMRLRMAALPEADEKPALLPAQPRVKARDFDQAAGVAAVADAAFLVEGFDFEADHAAFDRDHLRRGAHRAPTSVAARWRISTSVPTVTQPGGKTWTRWRRRTPSPFPGSSSASHRPSAYAARNARRCAPAAPPACARRSCRP